jgi:hypothetical protein
MLHCCDCGDPITDEAEAWFEVLGWEHPRSQGGTNAIAFRARTGTAMCNACMQARKLRKQHGPVGATLFES